MCFAAATAPSQPAPPEQRGRSGLERQALVAPKQAADLHQRHQRPVGGDPRATTAPSASPRPGPRVRGRTGSGPAGSSSSRPASATMGVRRRSSSETAPRYSGAMQKSKSSSSVVQSLEKIWKTRSKSHSRASGSGPGAGPGAAHEGGAPTPCSWTPQGNCTWSCGSRRVQLAESTPLLQLTEVERQVLQKVALAKLQALNLGVAVRIPSEKVAAEAAAKPKRRAYLLKRKALTTGVVDGRKDPDKDNPAASGLVFGLPLTQCIENERGPRSPSGARSQASAGSGGSGPGRGSGSRGTGLAGLVGLGGRGGASRSSAGAADDGGSVELRRKSHHGSRASFSSLVEAPRHDDAGSVEDLLGGPMAGSVPGQLNSLSSATSATDFLDDEMADLVTEPPRLPWVPHVVNTCLRHLTTHGLHTLGIFRVSSSKKRVRQLREEFDGGQDTSLDDDLCPHDVATLLKEYFRDLPDPLLCRDLYQAFVQTQRIRNRRLQAEALQHLVQLLPPAHRDTLHSLLAFLGEVARNAADRRDDASGDWLTGNRMDSSNLATLFAPNILHCNAPAAAVSAADELSAERAEERADTINVVRSMIDNSEFLFQVPAELLDEAYMHMMDSHPQALDYLLRRRAAEAGEDIEPDADEHAERSERRVWSREEFLHERCATPADDEPVSRGSRRSGGGSRRRSRVDSAGDSADSGTASGSGPGVITASLKIPVPGVGVGPGVGSGAAFALSVDDSDIPYIEDGVQDGSGRHQVTVGLVRGSLTGSSLAGGGGVGPAAGSLSQRRRQRSGSGSVASDSSTTTTGTTTGGAAASQGTRDSAVGSYSSPPRNSSSSPPSWTSSPPLSPDPLVRNVNYIPDVVTQPAAGQDLAGRRAAYSRTASTSSEHHVQTTTLTPGVVVQRVTFTSIGDADVPAAAAPAPAMTPATVTAMAGIGGRRDREPSKPSTYQRILSSLTGHVHAATAASSGSELAKSATTSFIGSTAFDEREVKDFRDFREEVATAGAGAGFVRQERDRIITPSISSIGGAVLRSKTADIERMLRISRSSGAAANATTTGSASEDKKKYTKRRYTRHIPEADSLATVAASRTLSGGGGLPQAGVGAAPLGAALGAGGGPGAGGVPGGPRGSTTQGPVWKRRELIASDPKRHGAI